MRIESERATGLKAPRAKGRWGRCLDRCLGRWLSQWLSLRPGRPFASPAGWSSSLPAALVAGVVFFAAGPASAVEVSMETGRQVVTIGVSRVMNNFWGHLILRESVKALAAAMPAYEFRVEVFEKPALQKAVYAREVDYFIASSGFYLHSNAIGGTTYLATLKGPQAADASQAMGATYVTAAAKTHLNRLDDLWNQRIAAVGPSNFYSWMVLRSEIAHLTKYPDSWFGRVTFTGDNDYEAVRLVLQDRADVAVIPACRLEALVDDKLVDPSDLRIVNEQFPESFGCQVSSALYAGSVWGAVSGIDPDLNRRIAGVLFTQDFSAHRFAWVLANDFRDERFILEHFGLTPFVDDAMKEALVRKRFTEALIIGSILLILAAAYGFALNRTIRRKTRDLEAANEEKNHLERSGVVSGLSSLIAHEIRQPLTSITSYAEGLQLYLKNNPDEIVTEATTEIRNEARRISDIVDRVRAYAKKQTRPHVKSNLTELILKARHTVMNGRHQYVPIETKLTPSAFVFCEPLEMELLFANLMNNAVQAVGEGGRIRVEMTETLENWIVTVTDNGPRISDEAYERLARPMSSQKIEGLGLGLTLCRAIVIKHEGHLSFERMTPQGLCAKVILPKPAQGIPGDPSLTEIHLD